jgi:uncharacterized MAPEG superfamily protein
MSNLPDEMFWLACTAVLTAVLWAPYIINRLVERGLDGAAMNSAPPAAAKAAWAQRLSAAHDNAAVALAIFTALVFVVQEGAAATATTALAAQVFFWARLAHAVLYTAGVPLGRTLAFTVGFLCQMVLAWSVLFAG